MYPSRPRRLTLTWGCCTKRLTSWSLFPANWFHEKKFLNKYYDFTETIIIPCTANIRGVFPLAYWALIFVQGSANNSRALTSRPVNMAANKPILSRFSKHWFLWWALKNANSSSVCWYRQQSVAWAKSFTENVENKIFLQKKWFALKFLNLRCISTK